MLTFNIRFHTVDSEIFEGTPRNAISQSFNHPSSVTVSIPYIIHMQVGYNLGLFSCSPMKNNVFVSDHRIPLNADDSCQKVFHIYFFASATLIRTRDEGAETIGRLEEAIALERRG